MAEIPNALTNLLWGKTLDEIYETLRCEKCLSAAGIEHRTQVISRAAEAEAEWQRNQQRGMVGGTREYCIVLALMGGGYFNARARKLLDTITYKPEPRRWWRFWRRK